VNSETSAALSALPICTTTYTPTSNAGTSPATTCSGASSVDYSISYVDGSVVIAKAAQAALSLTSTNGTYGTGLALATSGGTTSGAVTYVVANGTASGCSESSGTLTSSSAGTCAVTATMAGSTNYNSVSTSATTVTLASRAMTITAADEAIVFGNSLSPGYTVSSGTLAYSNAISGLTYTYEGTGSTSYGPSTTAPTGGGTYSVTPSAVSFSNGSASSYDVTYVAGAVTIGRASQTITFAQPSAVTYLDAPFALTPTSSSSLAVSLSSNTTSVCTVSSGVVTIAGAGTCSITASQAGDADYAAATDVTRTFTVSKANQATLSMTSPTTAIYGETVTLAAAGGSGTGAVNFSVTDGTATGCAVSTSTLAYSTAGTCLVTARRTSDANYNQATSSTQTVTISEAGQTLAFTSTVPTSPVSGDSYTPTALAVSTVTGSSSGVTPTFAASGTCSISGGVVTFSASGNCVITASAAALAGRFTAAVDVTQTIVVGSINQSISFAQPSNKSYGSSSFASGATASSGLTVTYSLGAGTTSSACSVSSLGVVTILAVGTCEVVASQSGDSQYAAASSVTRAFQVVPALATAPFLTSASASSQAITVGIAAPGFTGGVSITGYELVATPTGGGSAVTNTSCTGSPCTITGLTNGTEYTVTAAAINAAGTGPASVASGALTPATAAYAVQGLSALPGNTTVTVSWTPLTAAQLGGGSFTNYRVSYRVAGTSSWTTATSALTSQADASYTVTGLSNGASYDFQVVAFTSANSAVIAGNTAEVVQYPSTVPTAPRSLATLAATATDVQFSWVAPLSDGGAVLTSPYYSVAVTSTTSGATSPVSCTFASATDRFCTVTGLTNGAVYTFSVAAMNRMGTGTAATMTYAVPSNDATLSDLLVAGTGGSVALSPSFASATTSYTASVANGMSSVTVTPTTTMAGSTVTVDGVAVVSGSASSSIALMVGSNAIEVEVTASDPRYTETYTITITRAAAAGGGAGGQSREGEAKVPVTPPTDVLSGNRPGAVLVDGLAVTNIALTPNGSDTGWDAVGTDFALSVQTRSATGAPEPLAPGGAMQVPVGGEVIVNGDGYLPSSDVNVFAVPRGQAAAVVPTANRVIARIAYRAAAGAVYLGSAPASSGGVVAATFTVPAGVDLGAYVLQVNGVTDTDQVRSVNLLMDVVPGAPSMTEGMLREAAFYKGASAVFSANGKAKLRAMVEAIPAGAESVEVTVVGVSTALETPRANLRLARDRAEKIVAYLKDAGVKGKVTVSLSTTFDLRSGDTSGASSASVDKPMTSSTGKPLTTASIAYAAPVGT